MKNLFLLLTLSFLVQGLFAQTKTIPLSFQEKSIILEIETGETWLNSKLLQSEDSLNAGPHYVIWVEDADGNYIETLYITKNKPVGKDISVENYNADVLPFWTHKRGKLTEDTVFTEFVLMIEINSPMDYNDHYVAKKEEDPSVYVGGQPSLIYSLHCNMDEKTNQELKLLGYGGNEKIVIDLSTITTAQKIVKSIRAKTN